MKQKEKGGKSKMKKVKKLSNKEQIESFYKIRKYLKKAFEGITTYHIVYFLECLKFEAMECANMKVIDLVNQRIDINWEEINKLKKEIKKK